jgi:hypothetical protein
MATDTMSFDLLQLVRARFTPTVVNDAASQLGESREKTEAAISTSVPSLLSALSGVASSERGASHLQSLVKDKGTQYRGALEGTGALFGTGGEAIRDQGAGLLKEELGPQSSTIAEAVAETSGVGQRSAWSLLSVIFPVTLGVLGKHAGNLSPGALSGVFRDQRRNWFGLVPVRLRSLFGVGQTERAVVVERRDTREWEATHPRIREVEAHRRPLWPLLLLGLCLLGLIGYLLTRRTPTTSGADVVKQQLVAQGVNGSRIGSAGLGQAQSRSRPMTILERDAHRMYLDRSSFSSTLPSRSRT